MLLAVRGSHLADFDPGGSVESQREFLESLSANQSRASLDSQDHKVPPVANSFALGYTYYHVLDADQEGEYGCAWPSSVPSSHEH